MMKDFGKYPIDSHLEPIAESLRSGSTCLIKAEPGAGKTTRVPLHLLNSVKGEILVLEPRRLAARLSAERCAWFLGQACGQEVGYRISQDKKVSGQTRLTFITEGLFVRLMRDNPTLKGVGAVILDEFHERNIHTDIALVLVRNLQQHSRADLKLVVMSATLETTLLEEYLQDARVFDIEGTNFPVDVEYHSDPRSDGLMNRGWEERLAEAVKQMMRDPRCPGHILVFLTGMGDIMQAKRTLESRIPAGSALLLPLAAGLPLKEQQKIFAPGDTRKIVLSTNVAETSLTIPGITGVIDLGLAKIPAHAPWSGMPTLEIKRISQASAIQRGGRAGRTRSGLVYRLYSKPDFLNRPPFTPPDIRRIDISHMLLEVMNLGHHPDLMQWLEPPEEKNLDSALQLLTYLGAMDKDGVITPLGKKLSILPLHPRLAAVVLEGIKRGYGEDALLAACLISEHFILKGDAYGPGPDEQGEPCDVAVQLDLLKAALHKRPGLSPYPARFLDINRQKRIVELYRTLARVCKLAPLPPPRKTDAPLLSRCIFKGYPDRVAQRRNITRKTKGKGKGAPALYNFCLGRGGLMGKSSFVQNTKPDFLVAIEAVENLKADAAKGVTIRACSSLNGEFLKEDPASLMRETSTEKFDEKEGAIQVWKEVYYGKLKIESKKAGILAEGGGLAEALAENWPYPFEDDAALSVYHKRVALLEEFGIEHNCPVFKGEMLQLFFQCICEEVVSLRQLGKQPLETYICRQLSHSDRALLEAYAPLEMKLRNGKTLKVNYREGKDPWAEIMLQECFGLKETPKVVQGKQPVILHLLGPNRRPMQVTADLGGFWKGGYAEVSRQLSRRYPKHHWPQNPASAPPVLLKRHLNL